MSTRLAEAIKNGAAALGVDPYDLATAMSYETGGTFDEWKRGPTTKWGTHRGLIQWGEPQARQYGVYKGMPVEAQVMASVRYLRDRGVKPGMGLLDIYSAINAGGVGLYNRSDAHAGGAPGTVRDKVLYQMEGHKANARKLLGGQLQVAQRPIYEDAQGAPAINYDIYAGVTAPQPFTIEERAAQTAAQPRAYGFFEAEGWQAAAQSDWYTSWMLRKGSEGAIDPGFMGPSVDQWNEITKTLPENYHEYVASAGSSKALEMRLKYAQEDMVRQQRLAEGGWTTFAQRLIVSMADPVAIIPNILSGGVAGAAMKGGLGARVAAGAVLGGATNFAMDYGAGEMFDDPNTNPLMALGVGALLGGVGGALARNPATAFEAEQMVNVGRNAIRQAEQGFVSGGAGSAGAARNPGAGDTLLPSEWGLNDDDVPTAFGGGVRFDAAGQMTTADEPLTRLVGQTFFEESVGFKDHSVVPDSVSIRATQMERKLLGNLNSVYQKALADYVSDGNLFRFNLAARARRADEFREAVTNYVEDLHPDPNTHEAIVRGAQAQRAFYAAYQKEIQRSGLMDLNPDPNYVPKFADHMRVSDIDQRFDPAGMVEFIKQAVLKHTPELDDGLAGRIAKGYWTNIRKAGYGIDDGVGSALGMGDKTAFKKAFADALEESDVISDEELDKVFDILSGMVDAKKTGDGSNGISRLKARTLLDYGYSASVPLRNGGRETVSINDFFVKDSEFVARRYGRMMSGRIAFANTPIRNPRTGEVLLDGIKSEADLEKLKNQVRAAWRNQPGGLNTHRRKLEAAVANIDFGWKRINGIPVYGQEHAYAQWLRRMKTVQFIRLMSNMGLNQIQETWKLAAMTGFRAAMSQLPAIRRMVDDVGRSVPRKDQLLNELEHMTGFGLDGLWGRYDFRFDDDRIGSHATSKLANRVDTALDYGQKLTADVSLMKAIHTFQQRWAIKAIAQQMYNIAKRTAVKSERVRRVKKVEPFKSPLADVQSNFTKTEWEAPVTYKGTTFNITRDTKTLGIWLPDGSGGQGALYLNIRDGMLQVDNTHIDESLRGKGLGAKMYELAIEYAAANNLKFASDAEVSPHAVRVYESLKKRGYAFAKNRKAKKRPDGGYDTGSKEPAFTLKKSPPRTDVVQEIDEVYDHYDFDLSRLSGKNKARLASIGLGDKEVQDLFRNLLTHAETRNGRRLVSLGTNKWDPSVVTKFSHTLERYTNRLVQQNDVGGLHRWMSNPVVQLFTQFRSFVLGAWAKSTLYSIHHMDPRMMVLLLGELAAGVATYVVRQGGSHWATGEDREKFMEEVTDPANLLKNGAARTATSSIVPMLVDSALLFTPWEPQFGSARASGSPADAFLGSPTGGHIAELAKTSKAVIGSFVEGRPLAQSELETARRALLPLGNFMPVTALFSMLIQNREKTAPRD